MKLKDTQKFVGWRRGRKEIHFQGGETALTKEKQEMSRVLGEGCGRKQREGLGKWT